MYEQVITTKPVVATYLLLHSEKVVDFLSLMMSSSRVKHTDLSLSSDLATQIKGKKNKPQKKAAFLVFDDESKHPQMC